MLKEAIAHYQRNDIRTALKLVQKYNYSKTKQCFTSLQLEAVCLAKLGELDSAKAIADKAIIAAQSATDKQQAVDILSNIVSAIKNTSGFVDSGENTDLSTDLDEVIIRGDNQKVVDLTRLLLIHLIKHGAAFEKGLSFVEVEGNLSVISFSDVNRIHMKLPLSCMPLLADYQFDVTDNNLLHVTTQQKLLNPTAVPVMKLMVKLYNNTNKLVQWQNEYPFFVYDKHPELLKQLFDFRPQSKKLSRFYEYYSNNEYDKLLIESFIGSREFTYQERHLKAANIHSSNIAEKGLLAVIDFLNHRVGDGGYVVNTQTSSMEIVGTPNSGTNELLVQYGLLDPFLSYFVYGFVDTDAPFIYSGKCEVNLLSGYKLVVLSMSGGIKRSTPLPNDVSHLSELLPPGIKLQGDMLIISDFIFPRQEQALLLKEVVEQIFRISGLSANYNDYQQLSNEVAHVINQLLNVNIKFWGDLQHNVSSLKVENNNLLLLCQHTHKHLSSLIARLAN